MSFSSTIVDHRPDRRTAPIISIYFLSEPLPGTEPYKISCMFCKRTVVDRVKGVIDTVISTPMPADDFGLAINIQCKLCGQKYRILGDANATSDRGTHQVGM